jgi:hypothetical protein
MKFFSRIFQKYFKNISYNVWTPIGNDVLLYLEIENFQFQRTTKDLVEPPEKVASKTDNSNRSSMMNLCGEHDSCQPISIMPTLKVDFTPTNQICNFLKVLHM